MPKKRVTPAWTPGTTVSGKIERALSPIMFMLKLLGLFPWTDDIGLLALSTIYSAITMAIYISLSVTAIIQHFQSRYQDGLLQIKSYIRCIDSFLSITASVFWIIRGRRLRTIWLRLLSEISPGRDAFKRYCLIRTAAFLQPAIVILVTAVNLGSRFVYWKIVGMEIPTILFTANTTELALQWARSIQGVSVVMLLKYRFSRVNAFLLRARPPSRSRRKKKKRRAVVPIALVMPKGWEGGEEDEAKRIVNECRSLHSSLVRQCRDFSSVIGLSFLLDSCYVFLYVTANIYYDIEFFDDHVDARVPLAVLTMVCNLLLRVVPLIAVLWSCDFTADEANLTRTIVSSSLAYPLDQDVSNQLKQFSIQLLHWKAEFSACGVLSLDSTLIYAIAANVLTYLVIIVQFASSVEESDDFDINGGQWSANRNNKTIELEL